MLSEFAFELAASNIRFGSGATREVGADIADLRLKSALVFTDPNLRNLPPVSAALESLGANGIAFRLYDRCASNRATNLLLKRLDSPPSCLSAPSKNQAALSGCRLAAPTKARDLCVERALAASPHEAVNEPQSRSALVRRPAGGRTPKQLTSKKDALRSTH